MQAKNNPINIKRLLLSPNFKFSLSSLREAEAEETAGDSPLLRFSPARFAICRILEM